MVSAISSSCSRTAASRWWNSVISVMHHREPQITGL
jgi:hypothetical protein